MAGEPVSPLLARKVTCRPECRALLDLVRQPRWLCLRLLSVAERACQQSLNSLLPTSTQLLELGEQLNPWVQGHG